MRRRRRPRCGRAERSAAAKPAAPAPAAKPAGAEHGAACARCGELQLMQKWQNPPPRPAAIPGAGRRKMCKG